MRILICVGVLSLTLGAPSLAQTSYTECVNGCIEASCDTHYEINTPGWMACAGRCLDLCERWTWSGNIADLNESLGLLNDEQMTPVSYSDEISSEQEVAQAF